MYYLLVLCAIVAYANGESKKVCCSMEDRKSVADAWDSVWSAEFTGRRVMIAQAVFDKLFEKVPDTKALFKNVGVDDLNSAEFKAHCVRVTNGLDTIINMAFDSDILDQLLHHLGEKHAGYPGMRQSYLEQFRECFDEVLPQAIPCFNSGAWNRCMRNMQGKIGASLAP